MLPLAVLALYPKLAGRRVLWFLDNTVSLYSVVKGSAKSPALDRAIAVTKFLQGVFHIQVWFEFVDSKGNWSDGISRQLAADDFAQRHGFSISELAPDATLWTADLQAVWQRVVDLTHAHDTGVV